MKTKLLPSVILFVVAISLLGCGKEVAPKKTTGSITFVITEENTPTPLSGVAIQLCSNDDKSITPSDKTDNSGRCTFSNIQAGTYTVNLSKPGYESKEGLALRINGGDDSYKEIALKRITTMLTVQPSTLDFGADESMVQKAFSLVNPNFETLTWAALDTDVPWIVSVCDKDGKKNGSIKYNQEVAMSVSIDRDKLTSGNNESTIVILSDNGRAELKVIAIGADRRTPVTNMLEVKDIDISTAVFSGEVLSVGSPEYTERGFVYSTSSIAAEATSGYTKLAAQMSSSKTFSVTVSDLSKGTKYYVRAYGKNSIGMKLSSNEISFTTIASKTSVSTQAVTNIDVVNGKATFNGEIIEIGSPTYSEKGFCFNKTGEPSVSDSKVTVSGTSGGAYSYTYAGLASNSTYYVRAYAIQSGKVYYGTSVTFNTDMSTTSVSTSGATNVTPSSATLNGSIVKVGSPAYSEKGFCYSTSSNPTVSNTKKIVSGNGEGNFSINISGLSYNTTYYYKAYAIQNGTVIYGSVVNFNTGYTETVVETYSSVTNIEYESAKVSFILNNIGDPACTEAGICYSTSSSPSINSNRVKGQISSYKQSLSITGLQKSTTYYFRAYAIQNGQAVYGSTFTFKTATEPSVSTLSPSNLQNPIGLYNGWQVQLNGRVNSVGDPKITGRGFKYSSSGDPESSGTTKSASGSSAGDFSASLTGLNSNTTYYVRAYVKNSLGYEYGELKTFTTGDSGVIF